MKDLIERLEKATGPSRSLSNAIAYATGWQYREDVKNDFKWRAPGPDGQAYLIPPDFSGSLDAAMTLAKPGDYDFSLARTTRGGPEFTEWQARVALDTVEDDPDETGPQALGEGHTAPLACCAAFLKVNSRSVEEPKDG